MKIRTLIGSTLLVGAMGLGTAGTAQAEHGHISIRLTDHSSYCPLHPGSRYYGNRHHDHGHHYGLYRRALKRHNRHHRGHAAYHHDRHEEQDGHGRRDRRHERDDDHDGDNHHRSSRRTGIGYTG
ncbi:MAG: hypothetical protein OEU91_09200 [Gammaproteobacteria bacterium]|nr:hypothetical protein [Gammaproteobacteria bacterium]